MGTIVAAGLERSFSVCMFGVWRDHRTSIAAARLPRSVDGHGARMGVLFVDPGLPVSSGWTEQVLLQSMRRLDGDFDQRAWHALCTTLGVARPTLPVPERIARAAEMIRRSSARNPRVESVARELGMSVSLLEHEFSRAIGAPIRTYRLWWRFRQVVGEVIGGATLTEAAHAAGFHDSAHFTKAFRNAFGLPPSLIFQPGLRAHAVPIESPDAAPPGLRY